MPVTPEYFVRIAWLVWIVTWWAAAIWSDRAAKRPPAGSEIAYRVLAVGGAVLEFAVTVTPNSRLLLWRGGGVVGWMFAGVTILGFAFTWWARFSLGRLWSASVGRKKDHRVVDTGPYAIVRHPIYTGVITALFATAVVMGTATALVGATLATIGFRIKARLEERFLRSELGPDAYDNYSRRVPMLVPRLIPRG